jgi:hypothetical protein
MAVLAMIVGCGARLDDQELPESLCGQGELRCEGRVLQLCVDDGSAWAPLEVCGSAALCNPEQGCRPLACVEDETRCFGYQFQRCAADGTDWEPVAACVNAAACDPKLGCMPLP